MSTESLKLFVSIVIPCFNNVGTIGDCLAALEAQSYPRESFEIIVADNGSADGSCELVGEQFPQVHLVRVPEKGSAFARNAGNAVARGELILSTDADCVADREWIASLVKAMAEADARVAAIGGAILPYVTKTLVERYKRAWVSQPAADSGILYTATPNAIFRASALQQVGGFDGSAGHDDSDLGIRLTKAGYKVAFTDKAKVYHRNPVRLGELYRHRQKYGERNFTIAGRHPELFGSPVGARKRRALLFETLRRVLGNVVKLPISFLTSSPGRPRGWPVVDAVMAWGNYSGFVKASRAAERT